MKEELFDSAQNKIFFGSHNKLDEWLSDDSNQAKAIDRIKLMLKNYLELDNVSFLFGTGTSLHLGAVSIRNFPNEVKRYIKIKEKEISGIYKEFISTVNVLQNELHEYGLENQIEGEDILCFLNEQGWKYSIFTDGTVRDSDSKEIVIEYEKVLNYLIAKDFILDQEQSSDRKDHIKELIKTIKEGLFLVCDVDKRDVPQGIIERKKESPFENKRQQGELLEKPNKYIFHEKFIKALLQRPLNLRRANIFTSNYDLAFEYAFDRLGVHYIDGFAGFHKRYFKPETFEYDIFYPGSTTAGKVQRIEKVVRYFKLHGSLSWVNSEKRDANNLYGIEEKPLELIEKQDKKGEIIIYPSAVKKSYTLDLPYSELFRQFAATINQSQSVLITIGYSFADEHFNDIIYQALSNPTFTLIVVDYSGTKSPYIMDLKNLNDPRIIILEGEFFGDFLTFADTLMPNFNSIDTGEEVAKTLNQIYKNDNAASEPKPTEEQAK
jgi:hypothetical protein